MSSKGQTQTSTTSSVSAPWAPAQPLLQDLLTKYGGMSTDLTGDQQSALQKLMEGASNIPGFGAESSDAISKIFQTSTAPQAGILSDAYSTLQGNLGATASGAELNPYNTPGFAEALDRASGDITNRVKSVYAAAGRDPSGAGSFAGSLGRGLSEGLAPTIAAQFNQNKANQMNAANTLFGAGGSTATGLTQQQGFELDALLKGIGAQGEAAKAWLTPGEAALGAANTAYELPWSNLAQLLGPLTSIGALGGQTSGTQTQTGPGQSALSNIIGGTTAALGLGKMLFSDERVKEDIAPVGMLNDGQTVVRYRYKGSPTFQIGLLAQDVAENEPGAVGSIGDILAVDYERATDRAAEIGRMAA